MGVRGKEVVGVQERGMGLGTEGQVEERWEEEEEVAVVVVEEEEGKKKVHFG